LPKRDFAVGVGCLEILPWYVEGDARSQRG
jgi:hypothetical protein